eukprot:222926_1
MSTYDYTYFDYLSNAYEGYYDYYYETIYWPAHYGPDYNGTYPPSPYEFVHPKLEYINPFLYAFIIIMAIISIAIAVFVYYKMFAEHCNPSTKNAETDKMVLGLTLFSLTVHMAQNTTSTVLYYYMFIAFDAAFSFDVLLVWDIFFCLTRVSLYALFIYRLFLIFQAQRMLYPASVCYKATLWIIAVIIMLTQCTFYVLYVIVFYGYSDLGHPDVMELWKNVYWAFLALDFVFIGILGYALSRSILVVIKDMQSLAKPKPDVIQRTTTLSSGASGASGSGPSGSTKVEVDLAQYVENTNTRVPIGTVDLSASGGSASDTEVQMNPKSKELGGDLVRLATKIALLVLVSMLSSFVYQFLWMCSYEFGDLHLLLFSYTWCFDSVTNMICIYLSLGLAKDHYKKLCFDVCKCHQCALRCITRVAHVETTI